MSRELLEVVDDEVAKLVASGVTESELAVAGLPRGLDAARARGQRAAWPASGAASWPATRSCPLDEQLDRIRAVTTDDVAAVSSRVFGAPRALAVVGHVDPSLLN